MTTVARTTSNTSSHFYLKDGTPFYEVPYADPSKGMRKANLGDAKKVGALPSVTTILKLLNKPELNNWLVEQAVLAVLTTPRNPGEADDAFVERVLHTDRVQDAEAQQARELGTDIHDALELAMNGQQVPDAIAPWIRPAVDALKTYGATHGTEIVLVGDGYAGKTDLVQSAPDTWWLWDFKTTKKLPDPKKGAYAEHRLQLSAYASAFTANTNLETKPVKTANIYISTVECGKFVICEHTDWQNTYACGFLPLVTHWQWSTGYRP